MYFNDIRRRDYSGGRRAARRAARRADERVAVKTRQERREGFSRIDRYEFKWLSSRSNDRMDKALLHNYASIAQLRRE